jgi:hypothetical protein
MVLCPSSGCTGAAATGFLGSGLDHPEEATVTLTPGTYYLAIVLFAGGAPATFNVQIGAETTPPPPET